MTLGFSRFAALVILLPGFSAWTGCTADPPPESPRRLSPTEGMETVVIFETSRGEATFRLFGEAAPRHVENFLSLCASGFYDGTYFHRVAPGYLVQGGDPLTKDPDPSNDGSGGYSFRGPGTFLDPEKSEFSHRRGSLASARAAGAGSQFFVLLTEDPSLDSNHTVFGQVIEGLDVFERISEVPGGSIAELGGIRPTENQILIRCRCEDRRSNGSDVTPSQVE